MSEGSEGRLRVRVFVDYWNFQLEVNKWRDKFRIDWARLGPGLASAAVEATIPEARAVYEEMRVYTSFSRVPGKDSGFKKWLSVLDTFPGVNVIGRERKAKGPPRCPVCHMDVDQCPHCRESMRGEVEKGIDTAIVTDMIRLAWEGAFDVAVLISSDRDFIPAAEFLAQKGFKVVNGHFRSRGHELKAKCWGSFDITGVLPNLERQ